MKIYNRYTGNVILEIENIKTDLRGADLRDANLCYANLRGADLWDADLRDADLRGANLRGADLRDANLCYANLRDADLRGADLRDADLSDADLRGANLDFSAFPLWCGSFNMKVDNNILYQLCYHICKLDNNSEESNIIKESIKEYANKFHRINECGEIK